MPRPLIYVAIPQSLYRALFADASDQLLLKTGDVDYEKESKLSSAQLAERIGGYDAIVTGWGTPLFNDEVLAKAQRLKVIGHSAGSIKHFLPQPVFDRGIAVTHAAVALAPAVADFSLLLTMSMLRRNWQAHEAMREGIWHRDELGDEITGMRVGVVAASYTGRCFIKLLKALEADVWVFDPYLTEQGAAELGVKKVSLEDLLSQCPVISLQAPVTKETTKMIGKKELALIRDGGILVNTARPALLDTAALLKELQSGRISAALDVFDTEPLPEENQYCKLKNVLLSPHLAGASAQSRRRQGKTIAEEFSRFFAGEPLKYRIKPEMLATMA
jgi:phosphoglycerate dehydrogenase-like enzyme